MKQKTLFKMKRDQVEAIAVANGVKFNPTNSALSIIRRIETVTGHRGNMNWSSGAPVPWLNEDGTEAPRY